MRFLWRELRRVVTIAGKQIQASMAAQFSRGVRNKPPGTIGTPYVEIHRLGSASELPTSLASAHPCLSRKCRRENHLTVGELIMMSTIRVAIAMMLLLMAAGATHANTFYTS